MHVAADGNRGTALNTIKFHYKGALWHLLAAYQKPKFNLDILYRVQYSASKYRIITCSVHTSPQLYAM